MRLPRHFAARKFQVWSYTVGHRQLLLRSTKSETDPTRCDVLFTNVARLDLPTLFDGLEIRDDAGKDAPPGANDLGANEPSGRTVYLVRGERRYLGYVVAGAVAWAEDDGEYDDPSSLPLA